ncbi:hypothetical protein EV421DRAFT_1740727 [Armillaria borealis]|uniref:Uncharacterized protein n=1 Tax=Armillaria borealis TaxID=47425 RepID=A0AA39MI59_9AGAR|nr:hypothetical protein EV421DRAFT_1740727 [Armillaria borealis]
MASFPTRDGVWISRIMSEENGLWGDAFQSGLGTLYYSIPSSKLYASSGSGKVTLDSIHAHPAHSRLHRTHYTNGTLAAFDTALVRKYHSHFFPSTMQPPPKHLASRHPDRHLGMYRVKRERTAGNHPLVSVLPDNELQKDLYSIILNHAKQDLESQSNPDMIHHLPRMPAHYRIFFNLSDLGMALTWDARGATDGWAIDNIERSLLWKIVSITAMGKWLVAVDPGGKESNDVAAVSNSTSRLELTEGD